MANIDHLILPVNDVDESVGFYTTILGFTDDGPRPPFRKIRVDEAFTLQLAPWGSEGGTHLAFAMARADFDAAFQRIRDAGLEFGDSFHNVGSQEGPGEEDGARGMGQALYVFDPSRHLIEIRYY